MKALNNDETLIGGFFDSFDGWEGPLRYVKLSKNGEIVPEFLENQESKLLLPHSPSRAKIIQVDNIIFINTALGQILAMDIDGNNINLNLPFPNENISHILAAPDNKPSNARTKNASKKLLVFRDLATLKEGESFMVEVAVNEQLVTSITDPKLQKTFLIYPNPANNNLYIQPTKAAESLIIVLHNNQGKMVESVTFLHVGENEPVTMAIDNLSSDIYFVQYKDSNGEHYTSKFMKQ